MAKSRLMPACIAGSRCPRTDPPARRGCSRRPLICSAFHSTGVWQHSAGRRGSWTRTCTGPGRRCRCRTARRHPSARPPPRSPAEQVPRRPARGEVHVHPDPAHFEHHASAVARHEPHGRPPVGASPVAVMRPCGPIPERPAQMVEHDRQLWDGPGEGGQFRELGMEQPGVEAEASSVASWRAPAWNSLVPIMCSNGRLWPLRTSSLASQAVAWRIPRKRPPPAAS